jgi:hypothetical protein
MTTLQSTVEISIDIELLSRIGSKKFMSYSAVTTVSSSLVDGLLHYLLVHEGARWPGKNVFLISGDDTQK